MRPSRCTAEAASYVAAILEAPSAETTRDVQRRATFGPGYLASAELRAEADAVFGEPTAGPVRT